MRPILIEWVGSCASIYIIIYIYIYIFTLCHDKIAIPFSIAITSQVSRYWDNELGRWRGNDKFARVTKPKMKVMSKIMQASLHKWTEKENIALQTMLTYKGQSIRLQLILYTLYCHCIQPSWTAASLVNIQVPICKCLCAYCMYVCMLGFVCMCVGMHVHTSTCECLHMSSFLCSV